ncbi:unnamed protein product [Closterium sp. NIES-53]
MEVARTSMIHADAPHFLWLFAVRYAAHKLNLWSRVSLPETSPTLRWTGKVGDASAFRVWGALSLVRDTTASKLSPRTLRCAFQGFPTNTPSWQFYHPREHRVFSSQDVTFDESVCFYRLHLLTSHPVPLAPLFWVPVPLPLDPLPPQGPAPSAVDTGAAGGSDTGGEDAGGAGLGGAGPWGEGSGGAETGGVASPSGGRAVGAPAAGPGVGQQHPPNRLETPSPQQLREWVVRRGHSEAGAWSYLDAGAAGAGGTTGAAGARAGVTRGARTRGAGDARASGTASAGGIGADGTGGSGGAGAGGTGGTGGVGAAASGGARTRGAGVAGAGSTVGVGGIGAGGTGGTRGPGAGGTGGARAGGTGGTRGAGAARAGGAAGARGAGGATGGAGAGGTGGAGAADCMGTAPSRPFFYPQPQSSLPPPDSALHQALNPDFESTAALSLVTELIDFAARSGLDYVASLVNESESVCPPSVRGEPALSNDVLEDRQFELECLAAVLPRFASIMLCPKEDPDALDIPTPRSYAEAIAVKRSPGSPSAFKACYVARAQRDYELHSLNFSTAFLQGSLHEEIWLRRPPGFTGSFPAGTQWSLLRPVYGLRQAPREWHDTLRMTLADLGFVPSFADPSLFLCTDTSLPQFYFLVYVDDLVFATADTEALALVKAELQERNTCTNLGELQSNLGLHITRDIVRCIITLTKSHMVHHVLQHLGFMWSSSQPTPLPTGHSLSAPPSDKSVEPIGPYPELLGCLMYLMTFTRPDLAYPLSLLACYVAPGRHRKVHWEATKRVLRYFCTTSGMGLVLGGWDSVVLTGHSDSSWADDQATQRSSQGYTFSLGSGFVSWRSNRSSFVFSSNCEAEIHAGAMAAQELRWLTYLLTNLGEASFSSSSIQLQQRGQLRLSYVATRANTADVFTKALGSGDHQHLCTVLGLGPTLPHLLVS